MKRVAHYVFVRQRHNWLQFLKFGIVGGSGVLVNLFVIFLCNKLGPAYHGPAIPIPGTDFSVRWYHIFQMLAFLVANTWNYQVNRSWTFRSAHHRSWLREFFPFLATGLVALVVGLGVTTALLWHGSPIYLRQIEWLDESTGLRNPLYWANLIQIVVTMPINYVVNKLWTFRAVRGLKQDPDHELPMVASVVAPEAVDESGELMTTQELERYMAERDAEDAEHPDGPEPAGGEHEPARGG
ncbi:GtrA family protein [Propioniferax innocua]|uniref:Putative flippase GtrA n=1 Tax=Propioniferax innocua TaxID=1753 RepID=A0A542ZPF3_9ACTN|nr:GtrA family protein [Propioniferax innocua]TQL62238.1 putative flippase GtrA [Propioniferax innocua]